MVWAGAVLIAVAAVDFVYLWLRRPITTPSVIRAGIDGLALGLGFVLVGAQDGLVPLVTGPGFTVIGYYVLGRQTPESKEWWSRRAALMSSRVGDHRIERLQWLILIGALALFVLTPVTSLMWEEASEGLRSILVGAAVLSVALMVGPLAYLFFASPKGGDGKHAERG